MLELLKKPLFTAPLVLTVIIGYGFYLLFPSIGIDDLARERYAAGEMFAQGRFSSTLLRYALFWANDIPVVKDFIAVILLFCAAIVLGAVIKYATGDKLPCYLYTAFSCLFVSYPLINEIYIYNGANLNVSLGYLLTGLSLLLAECVLEKPGKTKTALYTAINCVIWVFLMSLYESFAFVYVVLVCGVLILKNLSGEKEMKLPECLKSIAVYAFPLIVGIAVEFLLGKILIAALGIEGGGVGANKTALGALTSVSGIISTVYAIFRQHFFAGFWYFPIGLFALCIIASLILCITLCIRKKNALYLLYFAGIYFGLFAMGLIKAGDLKYRICQAHGIFVPFTLMLLTYCIIVGSRKLRNDKAAKAIQAITVSLCAALVLAQSLALWQYFKNDYRRWQEEKAALISIGEELDKIPSTREKPVIFLGEYTLSDEIMDDKFVRRDDPLYEAIMNLRGAFGGELTTTDYDETYVLYRAQGQNGSVITWGVDAFDECNTELLNIMEYLGYNYKQGSYERFTELSVMNFGKDVIKELDDCIIVCLS